MPADAQKTVAGALLIGAGILSGNALLLTVAGGIGVNWSSEGLGGLWRSAGHPFAAGDPIARAGAQAIRRAADDLRRAYQREAGSGADTAAFDLVRECADAVAQAQYPAGSADPLAAQRALAAGLDDLLYGHDARQFLKDRLLDAVAANFRSALAADPAAWRLFYGWLLEQLAPQLAALHQRLDRAPEVLAQLQDQARAAAALSAAAAPLRELLDELRLAVQRLGDDAPGAVTFTNVDMDIGGNFDQAAGDVHRGPVASNPPPAGPRLPGSPASFSNQGVRVKGNVTQSAGDIYVNSAHVAGGGSAIVYNTAGAPPRPKADPQLPAQQNISSNRNKVFISYSHSDKPWLERLQVHLKPLERLGTIERWDDTKIVPGSNWRDEIAAAIATAKVAILLVSADFLASDFIAHNEIPPLLAAAEQEGAVIIPVIISPCRFEQTESLARFQAVNAPSEPLIRMRNARREEVFVRVTQAAEQALHR